MEPIIRRIWAFPTDQQLLGREGNASFLGVKQLRDTLADHVEKVGTAMTDYSNQDVLANRPAPGRLGRQFYATDAQTLYEDIGTAWIPIGGSAPFTLLVSTTSLTASMANDLYILDTTGGDITVTLPAATGSGFAPVFKKPVTANNLKLQPAPATDTIDGVAFATGYLVTSISRKVQLVDYAAGKWAIL